MIILTPREMREMLQQDEGAGQLVQQVDQRHPGRVDSCCNAMCDALKQIGDLTRAR